MKVLVTGYNGQLGYDIVKILEKDTKIEAKGIDIQDLDITNEISTLEYVSKYSPDYIIHCAAYTAVDKAEDDKELCYKVNVNGTENLVKAAKENNAKFIYFSTDYVFDGKGEKPFKEEDLPNPPGYYGKTKYEGELKVKEILQKYYIFRISWVFGINGHNFINTMVNLGKTKDELNIVDDQIGSPTSTKDVANIIYKAIQEEKYGTYHLTNEGFCSWADFAEFIFKEMNMNIKVNRVTSEMFPTVAPRPKNSRLSKEKLKNSNLGVMQSWEKAVVEYIKEKQEKGDF